MTIPRMTIWRPNHIDVMYVEVPVTKIVERVVEVPVPTPPVIHEESEPPEEEEKEDEEDMKIPDPLPSVLDPLASEDLPMDIETLVDAQSPDPDPKHAAHHPDSLKDANRMEEFQKMINHFMVVSPIHKKEYANRIYDFILNNGLKVDLKDYPQIKNLLDLGQYAKG